MHLQINSPIHATTRSHRLGLSWKKWGSNNKPNPAHLQCTQASHWMHSETAFLLPWARREPSCFVAVTSGKDMKRIGRVAISTMADSRNPWALKSCPCIVLLFSDCAPHSAPYRMVICIRRKTSREHFTSIEKNKQNKLPQRTACRTCNTLKISCIWKQHSFLGALCPLSPSIHKLSRRLLSGSTAPLDV